MFNLEKMQKKGAVKVETQVFGLIMGVILITVVVDLAPSIFGGITNLTAIDGVPTFVTTALPLLIGVAIMFAIWKAFK